MMFGGDGTPSVRLAGRLSGLARSTAGSETFGGVDGWAADAVEADGFSTEAPAAETEVDHAAAAARAVEYASGISGVDGFEIEPAGKAHAAAKEAQAAKPAAPAVPAGPELLRVEVGGPSAVAVVPMLCRLSKIKRPGAPPAQRRRQSGEPSDLLYLAACCCAGKLFPYKKPRNGCFVFGATAVDLAPGTPRLRTEHVCLLPPRCSI